MSAAAAGGVLERNRLWRRLGDAVAAVAAASDVPPTPVMVVDLDAFDANAADLARRAASHGGGRPIRVASKSLRVPDLIGRALAAPGFHGVLAYTLAEALWLVDRGVSDDVVVAYPSVDRAALARLADSPSARAAVTVMVDGSEQLALLPEPAADGPRLRVAIDVDAGLRLGAAHLGPKRSPLHAVEAVTDLARRIVARPGLALVGVMTYEGQVAGLPDDMPGQRARSAVVRRVKGLSVRRLPPRRAEIAAALDRVLAQAGEPPLEFWNAGGSGSIETSAADPVVTEVTAGSGLLVSTLFDHYRAFTPRPAAYFGLPVARRPGPGMVTVHGGGLVASGPAGADRLPTPWAPAGLALTPLEGAGEVQTPLVGPAADLLSVGDLVWFRHAKSGEVFEHTPTVWLLSGDRIAGEARTYRGHGLAF